MITKTVAVTINKGGAGKTFFCRNLATTAAETGLASLIIDMDTQENSLSWRKRRPKERVLPLVQFATENGVEETLERARAADCDLVVIDTPPSRSTEAVAAVEAADLVLIPCSIEVECLEALPRVARLVRSSGKPAFVVPNWVNPTSRQDETIREIAKAQNLESAPVALHDFTVHSKASLQGLTARELEPGGKAAAEVMDLWVWVCAQLQKTTAAIDHKVA